MTGIAGRARSRPLRAWFTLIELRVVVFVIAILAWFAYPSYVEMRAPDRRTEGGGIRHRHPGLVRLPVVRRDARARRRGHVAKGMLLIALSMRNI
ncbi:type IV pilin protein [Cupriavidus basilensis]